jgi:NSS family neurotransmitter:Na+ symporter|tara:strand:- start:324 stop:1703 length:1380 start_codon:yes stop_codon:yes gene_type:complete
MSSSSSVTQEQWSSRYGFLLASVGFAVGLGNIWRFPYVTGQNGGSAFLFIYLAAALIIGLPLLITELSIGRRGKSSAPGSIVNVAEASGASRSWGLVGSLGVFCAFIILSYYSVMSGWTLDYFFRAASGSLEGITANESMKMFSALNNNPWKLLFWNTIIYLLVIFVVRQGVQAGIERAVKVLMPALFVILIVMMIYSAIAGDLIAATRFLLEPDFSKVTSSMIMQAVGQAFFSIGIGWGTLIVFGSYLPDDVSIPRSAVILIFADTFVALLAGFAIFPLVFGYGLTPTSGAGLAFETLPLAFGQMPGGAFFGALFFLLLITASLSSCIGIAESVVSWVSDKWNIERQKGILLTASMAWFLGIFSILSFGRWSDFYPLEFIPLFAGKTIFYSLDFLAANILLLIGSMLVAVFFGWFTTKKIKEIEIGIESPKWFDFWHFMIRFIVPLVLFIILVMAFVE